jgi:hypothetical protein
MMVWSNAPHERRNVSMVVVASSSPTNAGRDVRRVGEVGLGAVVVKDALTKAEGAVLGRCGGCTFGPVLMLVLVIPCADGSVGRHIPRAPAGPLVLGLSDEAEPDPLGRRCCCEGCCLVCASRRGVVGLVREGESRCLDGEVEGRSGDEGKLDSLIGQANTPAVNRFSITGTAAVETNVGCPDDRTSPSLPMGKLTTDDVVNASPYRPGSLRCVERRRSVGVCLSRLFERIL